MTNATPQHAAIYLRISKDAELKGFGVDRQEKACRQLAARLGWVVETVLTDNDLSAWSGKRRPDYERLLAGLEDGTYDGVLCWATDRLYRRVADLVSLIALLNERNIPVEADLEGSINLSTASGKREAINHANAAEFESSRKSERIKAQRDEAAVDGTWTGGMRPFGFAKDGVGHHPTEAPALRRAVDEILEGRSVNSVATELGIARATLRRILTGPRIVGLRQHRGEIVGAATWEPIIDRTTQERVKAMLADPARKTARPARSYLLAGMVYAVDEHGAEIGRMVASPCRGERTYVTKPKARTINAEHLERFVVAALLDHFDNVVVEPRPVDLAAEAAAGEVVRLENELAELAALRGREVISMAEWLAARGPLLERLDDARRAVPATRVTRRASEMFATPGALRAAWGAADSFDRQRAILVAALEALGKIVAVGPGRPGSGFQTERISFKDR